MQMIKRIASACLLLFCLLGASALADITGVWSYVNGVRTHGAGFVLNADGTGEWLETLNNAYLPANQFLRTGNTFAWETVQEGEKQFLVETAPDGSERRFALREGAPEICLTDGADEGEYYPIKAEKAVLVNDRLDIITELQAVKGRFTQNKKYNVFQGPGAEYGRSGGGKGAVSTNGPIYCYGTWNRYLLIEYEISKDKHRFGWIPLVYLPSDQADDCKALDLSKDNGMYTYDVLTQDAVLTDDPFYSHNAVSNSYRSHFSTIRKRITSYRGYTIRDFNRCYTLVVVKSVITNSLGAFRNYNTTCYCHSICIQCLHIIQH